VGGWDEWCITEDAELSLRLLKGNWRGLHVDQSWGQGIMPFTFEALKGQRYRWCFGGIQILRMHWRSLLPGRRTAANRLTAGQRWTYLAGGLQWYGDLLGLAFYVLLLAGAANLADGGGQLFRKLTPFLVATVPALVALGLFRAMAASGAVAGVAAFGVVLGLLMAPGRVATPPNPLRPGHGSGGAAPAGPQRTSAPGAPGGRATAPGSPSPSASTTTPSGTPTGTPTPSTSPTPSASPTPSGLPTPSASAPATPSAGAPATASLGPAASPG
jgi:hypothetical protein